MFLIINALQRIIIHETIQLFLVVFLPKKAQAKVAD